MSDESPPPSNTDFDKRLREAKARRMGAGAGNRKGDRSGLGLGMRMASEMVVGLGVGVGIGLALDWWLGTKPWLLVTFFFLGSAAGMLNVYRAFAGYGHAIGYKKPSENEPEPHDET